MIVKDIVKNAGELVGISEQVATYLDGDTSVGKKEVETLLSCYNLVENELALDYYPLVAEEEISTDTGRLDFGLLKKPVVRFLAVQDAYGIHVPYTLYVGYLKTSAGTVKLRYTYTPSLEKGLSDACECALGVSERMMAYGVAAEYCFMNGLYEEGEAWSKKYRDSIMATYRAQKSKTIAARRWV